MTPQIDNVPSALWVFNDNYIMFHGYQGRKVIIRIVFGKELELKEEIEGVIFLEHQRVYVSDLLVSAFRNDRINERHQRAILQIDTDVEGQGINYKEFHVLLLWGSLAFGERVGNHGAYQYNPEKGWVERRVQHFVNFPFTVTLLSNEGTNRRIRYDDRVYLDDGTLETVTGYEDMKVETEYKKFFVVRQDIDPHNKGSWDFTFDYTFGFPPDTSIITRLIRRDETNGYYMRWIDAHGFLQYYLFIDGEVDVKTSAAKVSVNNDYYQGDMNYSTDLPLHVNTATRIKMCADSLDEETYNYVKSIISSPVVHLYRGKTKDGEELWQPVTIDNTTLKQKPNRQGVLQDIEITVSLPANNYQSL